MIIFTSGNTRSLELIMLTLNTYEGVSAQPINTDKIHFLVPTDTTHEIVSRVSSITGFTQATSPLTYLGCPIYIGRQLVIYYSGLVAKVLARITGWQTKMLSYGGRAVLIKHVLQSLSIHLLSAVCPPQTTLKQIHGLMADYFWGWKNDRKKYHWASWKNLSFPYDEGGIGFRQLVNVAISFQYKQWWIFRTKKTLWGDFLLAKSCQRSNPITKKWHTGKTLVWKHMMENKSKIEPYIQWKIISGSSYFWWDDCLGICPLAQYRESISRSNNIRVSAFINQGQWDVERIVRVAPPQLVAVILAHQIHYQETVADLAIWKLTNEGKFNCSSAWNLIREKRDKTLIP